MKYTTIITALSLPIIARADGGEDIFSLQSLIYNFMDLLSYLFWAASVAFFVLGVAMYIKNADDSAEREKGKQFMICAIIAFTVVLSLWGLVHFLAGTLDITTGGTLKLGDKNGNPL